MFDSLGQKHRGDSNSVKCQCHGDLPVTCLGSTHADIHLQAWHDWLHQNSYPLFAGSR